MARDEVVRRSDLEALRKEVRLNFDAVEGEQSKTKWAGTWVSVGLAALALIGTLGAAGISAAAAPQVICTESYERAANLHKTGVDSTVPDASAEQIQCDLNGFIEKLD